MILDLDFDFRFGFIVCTYNRLNLAILYSLNAYKKFKKKTWIGAPDMIQYIYSQGAEKQKVDWLNT